MRAPLEIVKATESFRKQVAAVANKPGGKKNLKSVLNTTYPTIGRLINTGYVRFCTLSLFVGELEGGDKDIENYITTSVPQKK